MKNLAIVKRSDGQLYMMEKNDFRLESPKWGYTQIANVLSIGKYQPVPDRVFKARPVRTNKADYLVFHDGSVIAQ